MCLCINKIGILNGEAIPAEVAVERILRVGIMTSLPFSP